jgi:hypothetical protein
MAGSYEVNQRAIGRRLVRLPTWFVLAIFVVLVRWASFPPSVIDPDESVFILMGRELLHGNLPYVSVYDIKPFGVPAAFALALLIGGQSVLAARILGTICVIATTLLLRKTARAVGMEHGPAAAIAILYAAFSTQMGGLPTMTEVLLAPVTTAAICIAFSSRRSDQWQRQLRAMIGMGFCFGIALWIKYVPAITASITFAALVSYWYITRRIRFFSACLLALPFGLLCAVPAVFTGVFYAASGHWPEFWQANFGFMSTYLDEPAPLHGIRGFVEDALVETWPLIGLAVAGSIVGLRHGRGGGGIDRVSAIGCLLWLTAELVSLIVQLHFFPHYFLLALPPLALLAGFAFQYLTTYWAQPAVRHVVAPTIALCMSVLPVITTAHALTRDWLNLGAPDASRRIAALIRGDATQHPTAWVVTTLPIIIYLEAGVPLPTRYPFASHLIGDMNRMSGVDPVAEIQRILNNHPTFIVIDRGGWGEVHADLQPMIKDALARGYRQVGEAAGGRLDLLLYRRISTP